MRFAARLAFSLAVAGAAGMASAEDGKTDARSSRDRYVVFCRGVSNGIRWNGPTRTVRDGETAHFGLATSQSPFVTGITPLGDPNAKSSVRQPQITILDEGMKIDVMVNARQPHGATVDATVEEAKITRVDVKQASPEVALQSPQVDTRKRRVIQFVRFGEALAIPTGEKDAAGIAPRVEILVGAGDVIRFPWTSENVSVPPLQGEAAQRQAIFHAVMATGAARISSFRVSRYSTLLDRSLSDDLSAFEPLFELVELYNAYWPVRSRLMQLPFALSLVVTNDSAAVQRFEDSLLGCDAGCCIELWDGPELVENVERLGRVSTLHSVNIYTKNADDRLSQAVKNLHARSVAIDTTIRRDAPSPVSVVETNNTPKGSMDEIAKTAYVPWRQVESAIPALKAMPNLQVVLIDAIGAREEAPARRALAILKRALPKAEVHVVLYSDPRDEKPQAARPAAASRPGAGPRLGEGRHAPVAAG
jgi:hypothetical protein